MSGAEVNISLSGYQRQENYPGSDVSLPGIGEIAGGNLWRKVTPAGGLRLLNFVHRVDGRKVGDNIWQVFQTG